MADNSERRLPWLESLLLCALLMLLLQISGSLRSWLLGLIDIRSWSRTAWFVANLLIVTTLIGIRFGPEIKSTCKDVAAKLLPSRAKPSKACGNVDGEYEERKKLAADWAKRAKNRRPFT